MSKSVHKSKIWPNGKRRRWIGGREGTGLREYVTQIIVEDGNVPALDVYLELRAAKIKCDLNHIRNVVSFVKTFLLHLQSMGMLTKKVLPD